MAKKAKKTTMKKAKSKIPTAKIRKFGTSGTGGGTGGSRESF